jgi:hypothetical protein
MSLVASRYFELPPFSVGAYADCSVRKNAGLTGWWRRCVPGGADR